jgi:tetratricopeptide (TPR) repeat protein
MAEDSEEASDAGGPGLASPAADAVGMAMERRRARGGKADPRLDAFLDEQTRLLRLQAEHLQEQRGLRRWRDRLALLLQAGAVVLGAGVVILVGAMAWQARQDHGLVIDAFSVPPDLAQKGLTGQVAASRFLDKLQAMQTGVDSDRPEQSYQNNWGSDVKVEIPQTGLTLDQFETLLRDRLGHVSHVSGEVLRTPTGIALTARFGDAPPQTFTGPETAFDELARQAAEAVYRASQPYRYAEYLDGHGRSEEAFAVAADLAANGPQSERGWAYSKWAIMDLNNHGDTASAQMHADKGLGYGAGSDLSDQISLVNTAVWSGHEEANLAISKVLDKAAQKRQPGTSQSFYLENRLLGRAWLDFVLPDYQASAADWIKTAKESVNFQVMAPAMAAMTYALDHDLPAARQMTTSLQGRDETSYLWSIARGAFTAAPNYWIAAEAGDWRGAQDVARRIDAALETGTAQRPIYRLMRQVWSTPLLALAMAKTGDVAGAEALIGPTAPDCYLCLRVRGRIAAERRDWPAAERWFAEAARQAPHVPLAFAEWGEMRLAKGDVDGAIAKLDEAIRLGPRFADPLELMGEALMRKGDYAGAAARFRQAERYAPHWPRNQRLLREAQTKLKS